MDAGAHGVCRLAHEVRAPERRVLALDAITALGDTVELNGPIEGVSDQGLHDRESTPMVQRVRPGCDRIGACPVERSGLCENPSMGQEHAEISEKLAEFIRAQHVFFVATAPSGPGGHVNVSPKGLDTFTILDAGRVAYLDLTGSGIETIAHLRENGRITLMFCAFEGKSKIVRLHGRGTAHPLGAAGFDELSARFPALPGRRAVIDVEVERVSTSCGFGVPLMDLVAERTEMSEWVERKGGEAALTEYRDRKNATSIDGLAGWRSPSAGR